MRPERIDAVREMIMAETHEQRARALAKIVPMQRGDFVEILREMAGKPVTIRLLDPPLHEFLPKDDEEIRKLAGIIGTDPERLTPGARQPGGIQPDARPSRVAARHQLS